MAELISPAHAHAEMAADSLILVIDDDASSIDYMQEALSTRSVEVLGATDAQLGISKFRTLRPGLVLLDLMLPGTNGLQLMQTIHDIDPEVQVIIFTGHYSTESAVQAIQSGAYDYLNKPVAVAALRDRVDRWIEEQRLKRKAGNWNRNCWERRNTLASWGATR